MKKQEIILILSLFLTLFSCNENKIADLKAQISDVENQYIALKTQYLELKDSISKSKKDKISHSNIIIQTSKESFAINENTKVKFIFNYPENFPKYDVYKLIDNNKRELILEDLSTNEFEYEYTPTMEGWNPIKLMTVFKFGDEEIEIPAFSSIKATK